MKKKELDMAKLKRKSNGEVLDCTIIEGRASYNWDNARVGLFAVYFDKLQHRWKKEMLENFEPAVAGIDF